MRVLKFVFISIFTAIFLFACSQNETSKTNTANSSTNTANIPTNTTGNTVNSPANTGNSVLINSEFAAAKKIYSEKCASCHKENGTGGKTDFDGTIINAEDLTTEKQKKESDKDYIEAIEKGFPEDGMPAFKGKLTTQEIKDVVAYIRKEIQKQ